MHILFVWFINVCTYIVSFEPRNEPLNFPFTVKKPAIQRLEVICLKFLNEESEDPVFGLGTSDFKPKASF